MVCLSEPYPSKLFKGDLPQTLLGPFLNTLSQMRFHLLSIRSFRKACCYSSIFVSSNACAQNSRTFIVVTYVKTLCKGVLEQNSNWDNPYWGQINNCLDYCAKFNYRAFLKCFFIREKPLNNLHFRGISSHLPSKVLTTIWYK